MLKFDFLYIFIRYIRRFIIYIYIIYIYKYIYKIYVYSVRSVGIILVSLNLRALLIEIAVFYR